MADECIEALLSAPSVSDKYRRNLEQRPIFIDATLGGGGHSEALLERLRELGADRDGSPDSDRRPLGMVVGIDRDPDAIAAATRRLRSYVEDGSFMAIQTNFADLEIALEQHGIPPVADGMLLDLGVSSHQIDDPERGFSFSKEGPLDMRMTRHHDDPERLAPLLSTPSTSAADIVNLSDMSRIRTILATYGEEPRAKKIADAIVARRPLRTTSDLVEAVASVVPERARSRRMGRTATLARVFQALRVAVNGEDRELRRVLTEAAPDIVVEGGLRRVLTEAAPDIVVEGGRLVVLGYHSLEDRVVKQVMKRGYFGKADVRIEDQKDVYGNYNGPPLPWKMLGKGSRAKEEEVELNPRARSAILRVGERQAGD
eukprot:CAMPEP_0113319880 /NCGR_PEP_ID=MMETSP0010_2-20120614/13902_1 /TAXON_ID=216773 ORGANISM="Corethron hystrix, Strain 308" /NCGR_SAMPLE_ID=MMETSP0010_2 /ASSEMBLY_ACC=CAM_ASM_000155 /LENGTH=371 /DNA_ID=CAMNT_0000177531 /DNA_START=305 /DNA_END=1420 /DNA_ORIENTATION=+ /assembly_acc=CAM_ASM_000155